MPAEEAMEDERRLEVDPASEGTRIDRLLAERFPDITRSRFQKLCRDGCVTAGGRKVRSAYRVVAGDAIRVHVPPPEPLDLVPQDIPVPVVYEDDDLLVVDKPAGLVVHPAAGNPAGTLVNALLYRHQQLALDAGALRPGIVHRLDKGTSGLLVVAKTERAHAGLAAALHDRAVEREYVALVWGRLGEDAGRIEGAIGRSPTDRKKMAVVARGGKAASTRWRVRERLGFTTLLDVRLGTGRTHQIRVHCAWAGHPVFGDGTYGGRNSRLTQLPAPLRVVAKEALDSIARQALHAARLSFRHPASGAPLTFTAPLPADFESTLAILRRPSREPGR